MNRQTDKQTDKLTDILTFRLIESIGPEGRCFEKPKQTHLSLRLKQTFSIQQGGYVDFAAFYNKSGGTRSNTIFQ